MRFVITALYLLMPVIALSQPYTKAKTRHRFAQLNFGTDISMFPGSGSQSQFIDNAGKLTDFQLNNQVESRLIIGGTHFWGHADFFVAFKVASFSNSGFGTFVETGGKYYPWRIEHKKIRPYIGASWLPAFYQQGQGAFQVRNQYPLTGGFTCNYRKHLFELGIAYLYNNKRDYYISRTTEIPVTTQPFRISIGYKLMLETTLSAEKEWQSGRTRVVTDTLAKRKKLNGFTIASGFSSAVILEGSSHNNLTAPFADNYKISNIFPEFGIGYYLHHPDIQLNIAYRSVTAGLNAYNFQQEFNRKALTLEGYKFFADYHGFVPFAGPAVSYEWLTVNESDAGQQHSNSTQVIKAGITAGWDIRPNRLQSWYLRTNLRWFPNLNVKMHSGKDVPLDQLEINFIQLVVFPGRLF